MTSRTLGGGYLMLLFSFVDMMKYLKLIVCGLENEKILQVFN